MRYYETLYILNPNFEQDKNEDIVKEVGEQVNKCGHVINHHLWGKKRLAYLIEQHKYGTYMLLQFETEEMKGLNDFDSFMKLNKSILRFQTVRVNVKPEEFIEESVSNLDANDKDVTKAEKSAVDSKTTTPVKQSEKEESSDKETKNNELKEEPDDKSVVEETS